MGKRNSPFIRMNAGPGAGLRPPGTAACISAMQILRPGMHAPLDLDVRQFFRQFGQLPGEPNGSVTPRRARRRLIFERFLRLGPGIERPAVEGQRDGVSGGSRLRQQPTLADRVPAPLQSGDLFPDRTASMKARSAGAIWRCCG